MIELASVIRDLREELQTAVEAGRDQELRFELGPIDLEVEVVVERSDETSGKVRFWIVDAGAQRTGQHASTQRIKLSLTPRMAATGRAPQVSGEAEAGES